MSGGDYLKKYVKKCLLAMMDRYTSPSEIQSLYWVFNKRMYTNSRSLDTKEDSKGENVDESESDFIFLKVYTSDEAEEMVDRMVYHRSRPEWQRLDPPDGVST
jgi:alpha-acetolactate decarboxylase